MTGSNWFQADSKHFYEAIAIVRVEVAEGDIPGGNLEVTLLAEDSVPERGLRRRKRI